ncbi:MAG: hypothetical protein ACE5K3_03080 [bacterium]
MNKSTVAWGVVFIVIGVILLLFTGGAAELLAYGTAVKTKKL